MNSQERAVIRAAINDITRARLGFAGAFALIEAEAKLLKLLTEAKQ